MRNTRKAFALLIASAAIATPTALAGCGGDDSSSTTSAESTSTAAAGTEGGSAATMTDKVDIADFKFDPETIEIDAGTKVTWTNSDDATHTATADDSSFDTSDIDQGQSASVTFDKPGEFTYYCRFHPFMKATVEVK